MVMALVLLERCGVSVMTDELKDSRCCFVVNPQTAPYGRGLGPPIRKKRGGDGFFFIMHFKKTVRKLRKKKLKCQK